MGTVPGSALEKGSGGTGGEFRKRSLPLTANAMPAARAATKENISSNPPPSSRAQGKQPMSYAPPTTTSTATTTTTPTTATATVNGQQPARTARAASKAPIPAHAYQHNHSHHHPSPPSSNASVPQKHRPPATAAPGKSSQNNSKIWSTSSTEERERIKEFWLGLGEDERRNLVKIEKDTVLRKMKEQQKHSCSCAVCGRKRHAIEEELERYVSSGGTIPPPPGPGPFPGSVELDKNGAVIDPPQNKVSHNPPPSNRTPALTNGRKPPKHESEFDDDDGDEEEYEEEEEEYEEDEEEEEEDEDPEEEEEEVKPRDRRNPGVRGRRPVNNAKVNGRDGLFNLGSNLTVTGPGNILTVADDLLKNDGQKFLEMMEQLAERRMQREEEAAADVEDESDEEDDEEGDDDDDDDDDEEEEDDDDDEEEEVMTEEQKMEEGKRMFSIFAARMFEQRVLQAFREKVAQERQMQLLRELEDEDKLTKEREAKKQLRTRRRRLRKYSKNKLETRSELPKQQRRQQRKPLPRPSRQHKRTRSGRNAKKNVFVVKLPEKLQMKRNNVKRRSVVNVLQRKRSEKPSGNVNARKRKRGSSRERREREEKERKAKEERDAKAAAEKAARDAARKEQQEREERERKLAKGKGRRRRKRKGKKNGLPSSNELASTPVHQPLPVPLRNALRVTMVLLRKFSASPSQSLLLRPGSTPRPVAAADIPAAAAAFHIV
ncbi:salt tolerance down-regulator-domain-containing protein [Suillus bovinus]|uniref:salt tolerance down-regulator-domain-containing protein n=1 Tax=Suillus bovinus TaxID=48563 RepID=UPI001B86954B|nr:salt tolerance down-regulator-domain-containing protein [Suillus bovinus]KAG2151084.1 salt tolerance down-regulator-domain-containing protein [Suillus bovinus]